MTDRRRVVLIGDLDDRLPDRSGGLDSDRLGLQGRRLRDAYPIVGDVSRVLGSGPVELEEVDHACACARPGKAAQGMSWLPHSQDQRRRTAE